MKINQVCLNLRDLNGQIMLEPVLEEMNGHKRCIVLYYSRLKGQRASNNSLDIKEKESATPNRISLYHVNVKGICQNICSVPVLVV